MQNGREQRSLPRFTGETDQCFWKWQSGGWDRRGTYLCVCGTYIPVGKQTYDYNLVNAALAKCVMVQRALFNSMAHITPFIIYLASSLLTQAITSSNSIKSCQALQRASLKPQTGHNQDPTWHLVLTSPQSPPIWAWFPILLLSFMTSTLLKGTGGLFCRAFFSLVRLMFHRERMEVRDLRRECHREASVPFAVRPVRKPRTPAWHIVDDDFDPSGQLVPAEFLHCVRALSLRKQCLVVKYSEIIQMSCF